MDSLITSDHQPNIDTRMPARPAKNTAGLPSARKLAAIGPFSAGARPFIQITAPMNIKVAATEDTSGQGLGGTRW